KKSVERTRRAMELGANGCLVVVPYYNKPPVRGILAHYKAIASVGLPVIAYHHPGRTGVRLNSSEWKEILQIDGVVALKEASGDLGLCQQLLNGGARLLCGDDHLTLEMMQMGAIGTISVVGNVIPSVWTGMVHACKAGNWDVAAEKLDMCHGLLNALNTEVNPIAIKCVMSCLGFCENELRLPLVTAGADSEKAIRDALLTFNRLNKSVELIG
ncbi:MAG: dihydrodipicolinate synthase family protein, partial [Chlamydiia bacterium]|nr:dihydrodipicolinate synthase family protein [Chlamydiia bacterium]